MSGRPKLPNANIWIEVVEKCNNLVSIKGPYANTIQDEAIIPGPLVTEIDDVSVDEDKAKEARIKLWTGQRDVPLGYQQQPGFILNLIYGPEEDLAWDVVKGIVDKGDSELLYPVCEREVPPGRITIRKDETPLVAFERQSLIDENRLALRYKPRITTFLGAFRAKEYVKKLLEEGIKPGQRIERDDYSKLLPGELVYRLMEGETLVRLVTLMEIQCTTRDRTKTIITE